LVEMSSEDSGTHAALKIGRTLELARKERGLSLRQVEQATKIRARYLEELERENFDVLPAVYVQGSLKTYANFLQLDGEALAGELRRRRMSRHEPQDPAYVEPPKDDYFDRSPIDLGGAVGAGNQGITEDEEDAGAASIPVGGNLIYLGSAAFLVLVLVAVALALTFPRDNQPVVSQVREPLISQAPSEVSRAGGGENEHVQAQQEDAEQSAGDENDSRQPEQHAGASHEGDGGPAPTGQDQGGRHPTQDPRAATQSAHPTAQATQPATAQPDFASTPPTTEAPYPRKDDGVPVNQSGGAPPPNARGTGQPGNATPGSRRSGDFDVQVVVGADDPVRITGDPVND
jgi:transcriptional regulator with XRE-family HTH domain